jgi:X-Pro dipeptidyl-peptidase
MRALAVLLLCLVLVMPAAWAQEDGEPDVQTVEGISEEVYTDSVTEEYVVETDHGMIYGIVERPLDADGNDVEVPVILTYSPYNIIYRPTNQVTLLGDATADYFVPRGYARAVFDVVGTRESSGCYDYGGIGERETGRDVVDFLGTQEWSNGKVGMIGGSYDGTTAIAAAVEAPEHLTTIVPQVAIDRWYDYSYGGGIRYFLNSEDPSDEGFDTPLAFDFGFGFLPPADVSNPELWSEAIATRMNPCERLLHTERAYDPDPVYDEFWDERDYRALADRIEASVLIEGGWLDHNVKHWGSTQLFLALPADHPKKLVMGQWAHTSSRFSDAQDLRHAWFDHWLLGLDTGVMDLPSVDTQLNTQSGDEREQEPAWPPPGTTELTLPLVPRVDDDGDAAKGQLALLGQDEATYTDDNKALTEEQMLAEFGSSHLLFLSAPVGRDVRISGQATIDLLASSTATETHYTTFLFDEAPDGSRSIISRGFLNARNRDSLRVSEPVTPDEPYRAPVPVWDVDWLLADGHRLGVAVASSNVAWVLPDQTRSTNTLELGEAGASVLRLPVSEGHAALASAETERLAGATRVQTAVQASRAAFDSAPAVVLARADLYPDALAGAPLAAELGSPMLLTSSQSLSVDTRDEIERLGAQRVVILGGEAAVGPQVAAELQGMGLDVDRVGGGNRFATAARIADDLGTGFTSAVIVEGANADPARGWPDAVSAAPFAAFTGQPILLVTRALVPEETGAALRAHDVEETVVVGGTAAVSPEVATALADAGHEPRRVSGTDRYATSAAVHAEGVRAGMDAARLWVATGLDWPDALTAGPAVAHLGETLLLVDGQDLTRSPASRSVIAEGAAGIRLVRLVGGESAITARVHDQIRALLAAD